MVVTYIGRPDKMYAIHKIFIKSCIRVDKNFEEVYSRKQEVIEKVPARLLL